MARSRTVRCFPRLQPRNDTLTLVRSAAKKSHPVPPAPPFDTGTAKMPHGAAADHIKQ
jgi:hypothetical protein